MPVTCVSKALSEPLRKRGGVIPYVVTETDFLFCLGVDTRSGDLTDFGGGISARDKNTVVGSIREFAEETLGVFDIFGIFDENSVVTSRDNMLLFIPVPVDPRQITLIFREKVQKEQRPEVCDIVWLDFVQFSSLIYECPYPIGNRHLYEKIRKFLRSERGFVPKLFFSLNRCWVQRIVSEYSSLQPGEQYIPYWRDVLQNMETPIS